VTTGRSNLCRRLLLALLAIWMISFPLHAIAEGQVPRPNFEALDEGSVPLTIDDVTRSALAHSFRPLAQMPSTNRSVARWYRFHVPQNNGIPLVVTVSESTTDAELYFPRRDGSHGLVRFGMRVPFNSRAYDSTYPALTLGPFQRGDETLYLRTYGPARDPILRGEVPFDVSNERIEHWTFGFAGFLFAIGLSSLFLWAYIREATFGLQAALMGVAILFTLVDSTLAWKYLWPSASIDFDFADEVVFVAYLFALILFSRSFLSLGRRLKAVDIGLWSLFALNIVVTFVLSPSVPDSVALNAATPFINFVPFLLLLAAGVLRWCEGFRQARFFTIGLAGMITFFVTSGLLRKHWIARWGFDAGVAFDALFFQFALADRLLATSRARDEAQSEALEAQGEVVRTQQQAIATLEAHKESFSRFVPHEFLTLLDRDDIIAVGLGDHVEREMTVLFLDVRSFTALSEHLTPRESFDFVNAFLSEIGPIVRQNGGIVDKFIGDAVMALFSGPSDDALDAAIALQRQVRRFNESRARVLLAPIAVGIGLHRGWLMLGTIGEQKRLETTVIAAAVNVASRIQDTTKLFGAHIVASSSVTSSATTLAKYNVRPLGAVQLAGLSERIEVFEICDGDEPDVLLAKMTYAPLFERGVQAYTSGDFHTSLRLFEQITAHNAKDLPAAYFQTDSRAKTSF
jgi:two-component system, sensor histidine kinase LadS